jgi:hypothetical protein
MTLILMTSNSPCHAVWDIPPSCSTAYTFRRFTHNYILDDLLPGGLMGSSDICKMDVFIRVCLLAVPGTSACLPG